MMMVEVEVVVVVPLGGIANVVEAAARSVGAASSLTLLFMASK